ncbi:uncharacterized protein BDR25DRAFT_359824 [Lindgomyces ingoldianus]|uniref:Uncharacterized protein n=1 Tax=Lindgomyces ingoldianus TaxID=673940 RepID=A0ACB6QG81_9PLEO|nr:uncharacterized protein BDR25DRAFT_359824 [Lindgomyces ingoldianus]KAF2466034.1 hypothetical protein BDR25DRAFT_359824 [Lindgomyces ingoldianus]
MYCGMGYDKTPSSRLIRRPIKRQSYDVCRNPASANPSSKSTATIVYSSELKPSHLPERACHLAPTFANLLRQCTINFENISAGLGATQIIQVQAEGLSPLNNGPLEELSPPGQHLAHIATQSYKNVSPKRVPDTCVWFLEHPTFQQWKDSSGDHLLWLSADPGCGKSVLSRALIDEKLLGEESATICHFFFKDNDEQNNIATALPPPKHVVSAMKKCGHSLKNEFEDLWQIFLSAASDLTAGDVLCIVDALDECRQPDQNKLIGYLERLYSRSLGKPKSGSKLKFLLGFSRITRNPPTIRLAGEEESEKISREIEIIMKAKVREIAGEHYTKIRTYLWLHLTLDEVKHALGTTEKKLLKVIDILPRSVEEAYEKILARCTEKEGRKLLQIIFVAQRPLTLSEIDVALESRRDTATYADLDLENRAGCSLLYSTPTRLLNPSNGKGVSSSGNQRIDLQKAHEMLSGICITHLLFQEFQEDCVPRSSAVQAYTERYAFLDYSANHWIFHVQEGHISSPVWVSRTAKLCEIGDGFSSAWSKIYFTSKNISYLSSHQFLLNSGMDPNPKGGYFGNALQAAARLGHTGVAKMLLDSGADINTWGGAYTTALQAACTFGQTAVLDLLLYA